MSEELKRARESSILKAIEYIKDGMVVGFGTGSTMAQAVNYIKKKIQENEFTIFFIPTSFQSRQILLENQLQVTSLYEHPEPDLMIDSFDQVDRNGDAIKGGGGAMMMEKVIAQASKKVIFIGDYMKLVDRLNIPIPIEILEDAYPHIKKTLDKMNLKLRLRESTGKMGPVISENGNIIGDVDAGLIEDPERLDRVLRSIAGVLETGIFPKLADKIIIGRIDQSIEEIDIQRKRL
ncbi:MAG: ribose 5-phosphate isomerase A [Aigarchaeota archaeon]|nr:ribose 5-phosphate isomerase A [Aigarchaeota archaeon]MCX8192704.1 ribose 5-phosphate isomerase A [Nitrososphaeria archaeon]MDW7985956.1 ribose 5-phosphate isomerase A [Nitrososphaerota archaeon]